MACFYYRINLGVDGGAVNYELGVMMLAFANVWESRQVILACCELYAWKIAGTALVTDIEWVRGALPLLQFMYERDLTFYNKLAPLKDTKKANATEYRMVHKKTRVTRANHTDEVDSDQVDRHAVDGWVCSHCRREVCNMYLRCLECWDAVKTHYVCCDCFFAQRYLPEPKGEPQPKWPNDEKENKHSSKKVGYQLRFRFIQMTMVNELMDTCKNRVKLNGGELPESNKTVEYLLEHARPTVLPEEEEEEDTVS